MPVDGAGAAVFAIHATTGVITTTAAFANLFGGVYRATIMASDGAGVTGVGTLTVEVLHFTGGDGTAGDPYEVSTLAALDGIRDNSGGVARTILMITLCVDS